MSEKEKNEGFDTEITAKAKFRRMHVHKAGKVEISSYGNVEHREVQEKKRINMPDEIQEGETYENAEAYTRRGVEIEMDKRLDNEKKNTD